MKKPLLIFASFLFALSACGETSDSNNTEEPKHDDIDTLTNMKNNCLQTDNIAKKDEDLIGSGNSYKPTQSKITSISIDDFSIDTPTPITFGQPFKSGDIPKGYTLIAKNSSGKAIHIQLDKKATHKDCSLRHGIISSIISNKSDKDLSFYVVKENSDRAKQKSTSSLMSSGISAKVSILESNKIYTAELNPETISKPIKVWLDGLVVGEWIFKIPFKTISGEEHGYLQARFNIRKYEGQKNARIEIVVENTKLLWGNAKDISYDLQITIGDKEVFVKQNLYHFNHARWRRIFWWGKNPQPVNIKHDIAYLIATKAVPNYDQSISISESALTEDFSAWYTKVGKQTALKANELMGSGLTTEYMPKTGGRADIGPLPRWAARYLLSMDKREKAVTLGTADQSGSFRIHIRDPKTDLPLSLDNYPEATIHPNLMGKPTFIGCTSCPKANYRNKPLRLPYSSEALYSSADTAHQPSLAYLPYLVTGDNYYLEEMQFWSAVNTLYTAPSYREKEKGLLKFQQIRGMAWSLRKLSRTAYITPDSHPMKAYWEKQLTNNINWLNARYANNTGANKLGIFTHEYALFSRDYSDKIFMSPWMSDFVTTSLQQISDFEYSGIKPILEWHAKFPVNRIIAPGYCWIAGAPNQMAIANSAPNIPNRATSGDYLYSDMASIYQATVPAEIRNLNCGSNQMAEALSRNIVRSRFIAEPKEQPTPSSSKFLAGEMIGYASSPQGYPSIMQAAVASAVDAGIPNAKEAWEKMKNRKKKPNFGKSGPEFAIIPR